MHHHPIHQPPRVHSQRCDCFRCVPPRSINARDVLITAAIVALPVCTIFLAVWVALP